MSEKTQAEEIKNKVTIEDCGPCRKKVIIEIPAEAIKAAADEQYKTLSRDTVVPGFRKGRAPRRLLEKRFSKEITEQVKLKLLADASDSAVKDNELDILGEPDIDFEKIEMPADGSLEFDFEVEVRPEFDLPELEGIPVNKTKLEVTDQHVDDEIMQLRRYSGLWTPKDGGAVEPEEQVIADAIVKVEGVEEEEKLDNSEVYVRPHSFVGAVPVEKLDELLAGAKVGDTRQITVDVPKTYFREEYRGKKVDIQITIKEIKRLKPADFNEDLFNRLGVDDEDELTDRIRDRLQSRLEQQSRREIAEQIYKYMLDNTDFELPTDVVAKQAGTLLQRQYAGLLQQGLSREQLDEHMEQLRAGSEQQAAEQLKTFFIMDKIADKLEIDVTEEEVNGHIARLAIQQGQRPERMREQMMRDGSLAQFRLQVRENKCVAKLLESAKITEVEAKKVKKSTRKVAKKNTEKTVKKAEPTKKKAVKKSQKTAKKKTGK